MMWFDGFRGSEKYAYVIRSIVPYYHVSLKPKIRVGFEAKLGNSS